MNKKRKKKLKKTLNAILEKVEELREISAEEQESFENLPEGIQDSPKGETMEGNYYEIDSTADDIEGAVDKLLEHFQME